MKIALLFILSVLTLQPRLSLAQEEKTMISSRAFCLGVRAHRHHKTCFDLLPNRQAVEVCNGMESREIKWFHNPCNSAVGLEKDVCEAGLITLFSYDNLTDAGREIRLGSDVYRKYNGCHGVSGNVLAVCLGHDAAIWDDSNCTNPSLN